MGRAQDLNGPQAETIVVSPDMTILVGRTFNEPRLAETHDVAIAYDLGQTVTPASVWVAGRDQIVSLLSEDAGSTRILLLVRFDALARIEGRTRPGPQERCGHHLPTELRAICLALRDCRLGGEARDIYRTAKAIELLFETWALLDEGSLVPVVADGGLSKADCLRLLEARALIDARCHEKLSIDFIARSCGLNREKLTRGFRELFSCTVAEAIAERRLSQASQMLVTTDLPVSSIGYESGYLNNASFSRAFGRRFGLSPSDYRASRLAA